MRGTWIEGYRPNEICMSLLDIDFARLAHDGRRHYIIDADNTLALPKSVEVNGEICQRLWFHRQIGHIDGLCVVSNMVIGSMRRYKRLESIAQAISVKREESYYYPATWPDLKPKAKPFEFAMATLQATPETTVVIGDQLFTDILGGNRVGAYTIYVSPLGPEALYTAWKRPFERLLLAHLRKYPAIDNVV